MSTICRYSNVGIRLLVDGVWIQRIAHFCVDIHHSKWRSDILTFGRSNHKKFLCDPVLIGNSDQFLATTSMVSARNFL